MTKPRFCEFKRAGSNTRVMININEITSFREDPENEQEVEVWLTNAVVRIAISYNLLVGICNRDPKTAG
jgi:hypothetical protein